VTKTISAEFPPSSHYVTGVGGTNLALNDDNTIKGQGVWNDTIPPYNGQLAAGSGGKSRFIERPSWQRGTNISSRKRTTPDVAFYADVYPGFTLNDSVDPPGWKRTGGTSGAAPFFAASMALVLQVSQENDVTLDLTNRMIYKLANSDAYDKVFQDVVIGNNDLFNVGCCEARPGYDMASGWGSLNITSLVEAVVPE
jgi:subtilase family serine protease